MSGTRNKFLTERDKAVFENSGMAPGRASASARCLSSM